MLCASATAGPLGERPPVLAGHFCIVPTTVFGRRPPATSGHFRPEPEVAAHGRYCNSILVNALTFLPIRYIAPEVIHFRQNELRKSLTDAHLRETRVATVVPSYGERESHGGQCHYMCTGYGVVIVGTGVTV